MFHPDSLAPLAAFSPPARRSRAALQRIAAFVCLAIIAGLAVQAVILAVKLAAGGPVAGVRILLDLAQAITWSVVVCSGIALGTTMSKARADIMGVLGFVFAPIAMGLAKASQEVLATLLGTAGQPAVLSLATISAVKAAEYGLLGWLLGRLAERQIGRVSPYLRAGAGIGIVFGGAVTGLSFHVGSADGTGLPLPKLLGTGINEMVFPIACALVIYAGQVINRHLAQLGAGVTRAVAD